MSDQDYEIRDYRLSGYYWIESAVLETYGKELGPYGIAAYNALACRAGNDDNRTYISAGYIAKHTGMSERWARRMIDKMEDLGLIKIIRRKGKTPVITLLLVEKNAKKVANSKKRK